MKNGKRPTKNQIIFIRGKRLNPDDWLVTKNTPTEMHLVHRHFEKTKKIIRKGVRDVG